VRVSIRFVFDAGHSVTRLAWLLADLPVALVGPGGVVGPQVTITTLTCQYAIATPPTGIGRTRARRTAVTTWENHQKGSHARARRERAGGRQPKRSAGDPVLLPSPLGWPSLVRRPPSDVVGQRRQLIEAAAITVALSSKKCPSQMFRSMIEGCHGVVYCTEGS
jgi:hypothetical protein